MVENKAVTAPEVNLYEAYKRRPDPALSFERVRERERKRVEDAYFEVLTRGDVEKDAAKARDAAEKGDLVGKTKDKLIERRDKQKEDALKARDATKKAAGDAYDNAVKNASADVKKTEEKKRDEAYKLADDQYVRAVRDAHEEARTGYDIAWASKNEGIFIQFFKYEIAQVNNVVWAVIANDWLGGFAGNPGSRADAAGNARPGVFASITNFFVTGPWWMISQHTWYFILFTILFSVIWAVFGGAIARIAAVHVARDEKVSLTNALRFSTSKFLSFIFAPIIPLVIVLVVGFVVMIGGFVGNLPWIGPILVGLLFFLALAAGFVMTLVLLGTAGGFNLMYPTIAVEGSDSFDAISRSFSYVYARPWRMLFYTLIAILYGALCFVFVRFFLGMMLLLTSHFVDAGMFKDIDSKTPIPLWQSMWPMQSGGGLTYDVDYMTLHGDQAMGAFLVSIWVYLTIGLLGAFAISFYFSVNTIIYYLMRREVDATELDDVYLEQAEEEFTEPAPATATAATTPVAVTETTVTQTTTVTPPPNTENTPPPAGG
jgi:hypothetical protein